MGSEVFFGAIEGFTSKDSDWLCLVNGHVGGDKAMRVKIRHDDIVMYRHDYTKDDFINEVLKCGIAMKVGKFLVPEFASHYGVTIDDISVFGDIMETIDEKHEYERIIYDAYLENGAFTLTDEQRLTAYESYKAARKMRYENPLIPLTDDALRRYEEQQKQK